MLLIDNGNTRTKFAIYDNNQLVFEDKIVNSQLHQQLTEQWLTQLNRHLNDDSRCIGCYVGEQGSVNIIEERLATLSRSVTWLSAAANYGDLINGYGRDWDKLGADRWFALLGYRQHSTDNAVIIDAGTALTIDWLKSDGEHQGGWIIPGRRLMQESLHQGTANLNDLLTESCFRVPATNTQQGMSYGVHYALVGAISQALMASGDIFEQQPFSIVVTGGDGERLLKSLQSVQAINYTRIDDLVFKGLCQAADNP